MFAWGISCTNPVLMLSCADIFACVSPAPQLPEFVSCRYFLRRLRRVKKANGQIIACNEVRVARGRSW